MLDQMMKLALPQLLKDPDIRDTINKVGNFVTTLDARLARIERACGIEPAQIINLPAKDRHDTQNQPGATARRPE